MKIFVTSGPEQLMTENQRLFSEHFLNFLKNKVFIGLHEPELCSYEYEQCGPVWNLGEKKCDMLIIILPFGFEQNIRYEQGKKFDDEDAPKLPVLVLVDDNPKIDHSRICIQVKKTHYEFKKTWISGDYLLAAKDTFEFLTKHNMDIPGIAHLI
ncbi:MAG: hypothetical protein PHG25_04015 [Candidatus Pacebacteria bacterium]|nr:hypothetical protein [Candidatus Paceibacterota bacterium]